jgi:FkbH-like protein
MYVAERKRKASERQVGSLDEWLRSLRIRITVDELNETNLQRTAQLLNKTNQMNLTTRRKTEAELVDWAGQGNHKLWTFRVTDKFGDSGLTGIVSLQWNGRVGRIVDFVLSCRVIGRKVEETMLHIATRYAQYIGLEEIRAKYAPTSKNKPCLKFFESSGFECDDDNTFSWEVNKTYEMPQQIEIENHKGA